MAHRSLAQRALTVTPQRRNGFGWFEVNTSGKKTAIIMHGVTGGKDDMLVLAERYAELGYAVYCPDLPGHGGSAMIPAREFSELVAWLCRFLETIGRQPDLLVSNSYASAIVYQYAQMGYLPETTHVVLGCPTPHVAVMTQVLDSLSQKLPQRFAWYAYNTPLAQLIRVKYVYKGSDESSLNWLVESEKRKYHYMQPDTSPRLSKPLFRENPYNLPPLPESVQRRITVVMGDRDNVVTKKARRHLENILPHATFVSAGPAGHILHFEAVDAMVVKTEAATPPPARNN